LDFVLKNFIIFLQISSDASQSNDRFSIWTNKPIYI